MKQERMGYFVEDIYNRVVIEHNIIDKKTMDILYKEVLYFNNLTYPHLDELSDIELYDYIYLSLSFIAKNPDYFI